MDEELIPVDVQNESNKNWIRTRKTIVKYLLRTFHAIKYVQGNKFLSVV